MPVHYRILFRYRVFIAPLLILATFLMAKKLSLAPVALVVFLPMFITHKNFSDRSELYHLLTGKHYDLLLRQKTIAFASLINVFYLFCYLVSYLIFAVPQSAVTALNDIALFNAGLFAAFTIGDAVRFSDLNVPGNWKRKVAAYLLYSFSFGIVFSILLSVYHIFSNTALPMLIVMTITILAWYFHCRRFRLITFKQAIIPTIYDRR